MISNEALSSAPVPSIKDKANTFLSSLLTVKSPTTVPIAWFSLIVDVDKVNTVGILSSMTAISKVFSKVSLRILTACTRIL